jgi:predicted phosphodiesterase
VRVAVLSDVHGNADALAAVLADIKGQSPDATINLGDCFSGPLDMVGTYDLLSDADFALTIRGNHDRWLMSEDAGDDWDDTARPLLSSAALAWLDRLPATAVLDDIFACHACPQDDLTGWMEVTQPDGSRIRAGLDHLMRLSDGVHQPIMLCGHTHVARTLCLPDGRLIVNPGTVGCPGFSDTGTTPPMTIVTGVPLASYAVLDRVGPRWTVSHRLVPYEPARMVAMAQAAGYADWACALSTGWI